MKNDNDKLRLRYGDKDVRLTSYGPFALYPGEHLVEPVQRMQQVPEGEALLLRALRAFLDRAAHLPQPMWRVSGDMWLFIGPAQYIPHAEAEVVGLVTPTIIQQNTALEVRATNDFIDSKTGKLRNKGEHWLVRQPGPFLTGHDEEIVQVVSGHQLTITEALHVRAEKSLLDESGVKRNPGDEWLVTTRNKICYIPEIDESVLGVVHSTHVNINEFCIVEETHTNHEDNRHSSHRKVVQGDKKFFLQPNQRLVTPPTKKYSAQPGEALEFRVIEPFMDEVALTPNGSVLMSFHLAVVFALLAYILTQPLSQMFSGTTLLLVFGTFLLCAGFVASTKQKSRVLERAAGSKYTVCGPQTNYVPSAQVDYVGLKKAMVQVPSLGIYAGYTAEG